jgi:hypothetical protein
MTRKEHLIQTILERELEMFLSVSAETPAACQQDPEGFRIMRAAQFSVWSEETLAFYCEDVERAAAQDRNLMTLKYARMDDLIPTLHDDPLVENLIERIVAIQLEWQKQMVERYPRLMRRGRPLEASQTDDGMKSFGNYLRSELETYSAETLASLYRELSERHHNGDNVTEAIYSHMVKGLGYASIEEAEAALEKGGV